MQQAMSAVQRETIRCGACRLVQFVGAVKTCKRCHKELPKAPRPTAELSLVASTSGDTMANWRYLLAGSVKSARQRSGMSQRQLAKAMGSTRQYCSKVENRATVPLMAQIFRIADALKCDPSDLIPSLPVRSPSSLDSFMDEIAAYVPQLSH